MNFPNTPTLDQTYSYGGKTWKWNGHGWELTVTNPLAGYAGANSITTLGTITTGVWNGAVISVPFGGTGLSSYTPGSFLYASGATTLVGRSPAQVLVDIGALPASAYTASDVISKLLTVDGASSGMDADLLDGQHGSFYLDLSNATGSLSAASLPAFTGDVTSPAGSAAQTIANNVVTLAKMADMATGSFIGRNTAGTGDPEVLSAATVKGMLNLSGTNTGDQTNITGNAGTATALQTARTINGVSFNGTANITITAASPNSLSAGNGLTGTAYNGSAAQTFALGTPGTLTGATTNAVTATSHTHALSANLSAWDAIAPSTKADSGHNHTLDSLSNTTITSNTNGEILRWNGTAWVNNTLAEAGIQAALGYTPYNSTNPNGYTSNIGTVTSVAVTGSTGLAVGGDPITTSGTLTFTLSSNLQSWSGIAPASKSDSTHNHTLDSLSNTTITSNTDGEILRWNGTAWVNNTLAEAGIQSELGFTPYNSTNPAGYTSNTGTVTSVTGGNGLSGSVTTSGSISLGTPGTLSGATTNAVTSTSHTHALSANLSAWDAIAPSAKADSGHNHTLDGLSNTTITSNTNGEILRWNGTAWVNNTLAEAGIQPAGSYAAASHNHAATDITSGTLNVARSWALTGDITSPAGSSTTTISAGAVTLAKMANIATNSLIGRSTAGAGVPEAITVGSGLSLSGGTLSATGGTGTVTSVSIVTANGVSGSVATNTTTPAITLTLGNITPTAVTVPTISVTSAGAVWSATNQASSTLGAIHLGAGSLQDSGNAITFGGYTGSNAQAGIYTVGNSSTGTSMYLSTTNSYASGPQTAISISPVGAVSIVRAGLSVAGTITGSNLSGTNTGDQTNITGNAGTATTLQTARTLTIGSTGKTFNGSANVAWSLAEIGAAATGHNHTLDSLSNTTITSNTNGEILRWNGTAWINNTLAEAGIQPAGSYAASSHTHSEYASSTHNHTLDSLSNTTITSNTSGEILRWNGTAWVNNTLAEAGIQPAGSYASSTHNHTLDSLSNTTITSNTNGEILRWNGTAWINNTLAEAGIQAALGYTPYNSTNPNGYTSNTGTVTGVSIASANGVSGSSSGGATPALTIALGAITPSSVTATGNVSSSQNFIATSAAAVLAPTGAGTVLLRPNGSGSTAGQVAVNSAGLVSATSFLGGIGTSFGDQSVSYAFSQSGATLWRMGVDTDRSMSWWSYNDNSTYAGRPFNVTRDAQEIVGNASGWYMNGSKILTLAGGTISGNIVMDAGSNASIYCSNWYRSYGDTGWYSQTYAGGICMTDTTYVRTYNSKAMYASDFVASSDARLKKDVTPFVAQKYLLSDNAVRYNWIKSGKPDIGFIAQTVMTLYPELVDEVSNGYEEGPDGEPVKVEGTHYVLNYQKCVAVLAGELRSARDEIDELRSQIAEIHRLLGEQ